MDCICCEFTASTINSKLHYQPQQQSLYCFHFVCVCVCVCDLHLL